MSLAAEIQETERLIQSTTFPGVKTTLQAHLFKLKKAEEAAQKPAEPVVEAKTVAAAPKPAPVMGATYVPIESFSWDQGGFNSSTITIFVDLEGVGEVKDKVTVSFGQYSFDLQVHDLNGKNYRLVNNNLEKDILPDQSSFAVKKNKVTLKLAKKKGEYSYDHWTALTAKKKRSEEVAASGKEKDPSAGIMEMMKNMYEDGDENMKKIIGEAMMKSQRGEKPSAPDMKDFNL